MIPGTMQQDITNQLHTAHLGKEKTKFLARDTVFWLTMNKDIEHLIDQCKACQEYQNSQQSEPLKQHNIPQRPWSVLGTDLFEIKGQHFLIVVDYYSKFPIVKQIDKNRSSVQIIKLMRNIFSEFGIPEKVVSDNGPQYSSSEFRSFAESWGFVHSTTSPNRPQGNGFVERQIQTVKKVIMKAHTSGNDIQLALLYFRITPISLKIPSPAEMLFGRRLKSTMVSHISNTLTEKEEIQEELMKRQSVQKKQFDKHARKQDLPHLVKDQQVLIQNQRSMRWEPAVVQNTTADSRSYVVRLANGNVVRRNRQHIRHLPNISPTLPPAIQDNARHPQVDLSESGQSQVSHTTQRKILNEQPTQSSDTVPHVYRTRYGRESRKPDRYSCSP